MHDCWGVTKEAVMMRWLWVLVYEVRKMQMDSN